MTVMNNTIPRNTNATDDRMSLSAVAANFESSAREFFSQEFGKMKGLENLASAAKCFEYVNPERAQRTLIEVAEAFENEGFHQAEMPKKQEAGKLFFKALEACVDAKSINMGGEAEGNALRKKLGEKAIRIFWNMKNLDLQEEGNAGDSYILLSRAAELVGSDKEAMEFKENALESFIFFASINSANKEAAHISLMKAHDLVHELIKETKKSCSNPEEREEKLTVFETRVERIERLVNTMNFNESQTERILRRQ
jgi:hypothetical protein